MSTMVTRRKVLVGIGAVGVPSLAGCMDLLQEGVEAEAKPAIVSETTAEDLGYEYVAMDNFTIDETLEVAGESRDINVTTWVTTYSKDVADFELADDDESGDFEEETEELLEQQGAGYAVVSTPSKSIAGQEINPVAHLGDEEIIDEFNEEISEGNVTNVEHTGERSVEVLGEAATVKEFDAVMELEDGDESDVRLYMTEVTHEDDIILGVGIHPEGIDERENMIELTENLEHPVDPST